MTCQISFIPKFAGRRDVIVNFHLGYKSVQDQLLHIFKNEYEAKFNHLEVQRVLWIVLGKSIIPFFNRSQSLLYAKILQLHAGDEAKLGCIFTVTVKSHLFFKINVRLNSL
jgi:hypothetical protein